MSIFDHLPVWGQRIELVEEHDAGRRPPGAREHLPHVLLRLSDVHVQQLGALHAEKVERALGGDGLGQEGLADPRRTVEQHAGALQARTQELRVPQGQLDGVQDLLLGLFQSACEIATDLNLFETSLQVE